MTFPDAIEVSSPAGQPAQQPVKAGFPSKVKTGGGSLAAVGSYAGSLATSAVSGRSWNSFSGASRRWKPGGGGKSRRSPSGRCGVQARPEIHQAQAKVENRLSEEARPAAKQQVQQSVESGDSLTASVEDAVSERN